MVGHLIGHKPNHAERLTMDGKPSTSNTLVVRKTNSKRKPGSYQVMTALVEVALNSIFPLLNLSIGSKRKKSVDIDNEEKELDLDRKLDCPAWLKNVRF